VSWSLSPAPCFNIDREQRQIRTCPGTALYNQLAAIRQGVADMRRPKFSVNVTPNIQVVTQGGTASFQITLQSINKPKLRVTE